jgi:hypothetical protein
VNEVFVKMPLWMIRLLIGLISFLERKKEAGTKMLDLLHTLPPDMKMAIKLDSQFGRYRSITSGMLLMTGSKSPAYFHQGLNALKEILPQAEMKIFEGFDHYSPEEKVEELSGVLKGFF